MNILLVFHHLRHPDERGGQRSREVAEALAKAGYSVTVLVPNIDPLTSKKTVDKSYFLWAQVNRAELYKEVRYWVPNTARKGMLGRLAYSLGGFFCALIFCLSRAKIFRIVAVTSHPIVIAYSCLPVVFWGKAKLILEVRDVPADVALERRVVGRMAVLYKFYKLVEKVLVLLSDHVIVYTQGMAQLLSAPLPANKYDVIPIGIRKSSATAHEEVGVLGDYDLSFCFFGNLGKVIDLTPAIQLVVELEKRGVSSCLDIYGAGDFPEDLLSWIKRDGVVVNLKGEVPQGRVSSICSLYDYSVYPVVGGPALSASLGNKFFDYLSAGTPIIVFGKDSEPARIVEDFNIGLAVCTPVEAVAEILSEDGSIRNIKKERCGEIEIAQECLNRDEMLKKWVGVVTALSKRK